MAGARTWLSSRVACSSLGGTAMDRLLQDIRYAVRGCVKAPGFTVVALVTMAIAIGANATVFSFVNALLLRPAAGVQSPRSLLAVYTSDFSSGPYGTTSYPDYDAIRAAGMFSDVAAYADERPGLIRVGAETQRVRTMAVTATYFDVLGVHPLQGRAIGAADIDAAQTPATVISESLWRRAFAADPSAVGATIAINGTPHVIVGVIPGTFTGLQLGSAFDIWTPLAPERGTDARGDRNLEVVGRLAPGVTLQQAQSQLDGLAAQLASSYPATNRGTLQRPDQPRPFKVLRHTRLGPDFRAEVGMIGAVLLAAVLLVLLIACANVAALLLSRATARHREVALRIALGAARTRLARQMLTESLLLSAAGGALGLLISLWTADVLPSFFPPEQARLLDVTVDWRVLAFTAITTIVSGMTFGIVPAIRGIKASPADALRAGNDRTSETQSGMRLRKVLVGSQVALAAVLLVSAALLVRSLSNAMHADLGYTTQRAVLSTFELPHSMEADSAKVFFDAVTDSVRRLPGVEDVALAQFLPVAGTSRRGFRIPGYVTRQGESTEFHYNVVNQTFFDTMGIRPAKGRVFEAADRSGRAVAVVNHVLADRYYDGQAVGRMIRDSSGRELEIVGVVRADRRLDLQDPSLPVVFYLLDQQESLRLTLIARTSADPAVVADTVRRTMIAVNSDVAVFRTVTLTAQLEEALAANRLTVALVTACGVMALTLALVGLYGVVSYTVVRRTREIGVRVALGARPSQVLRLLVAENGTVVGIGLAGGAIAAAAASNLLGSMLYGIGATDAATYGAVLVTVGIVAVLASLIPAVRALRVDPIAALRHE
jgi:putative ABC transport system permease protein